MKKWLSLLLTLMLLVNSVITPVAAIAEASGDSDVVTEAPTAFPVGYAYAEDNVRVFNYLDTDGDGIAERVQIGTIIAGGTVYVAEGYDDGVWTYIAFAAHTSKGTRVVEGYARVDGLTHVSAVEGGTHSYRDHALNVVEYNEITYDIPKATEEPEAEATEEPAEEPEVVETEAPAEEPEVEEPVEEPEATDVPEIADPVFPMVPVMPVPETEETEESEEPETEATEVPEIDDLLPDIDAPVIQEPETEEPEAPEIDDMLPELDIPVLEVPEVEEPETEEPIEEPEVEETAEPEVEEAEEPAEEETAEPEAEETEEPEAEETEEPVEEEIEEPITSLSTIYNGSVITLTAEPGVIPAGAELVVESVDLGAAERVIMANLPSGSVLVSFNAYDITLLVDGEVVQPAGNVNVQITNAVSTVALSAATETTQTIVYHIDGSTATEVTAPQPVAPIVEFVVPHFSVYVVAVVEPDGKQTEGAYQSKNGNGTITVQVAEYDEQGNITGYHDEDIDLDSAAFDFHIFTEDATLNVHTNGNIAADHLDAAGQAFGNNQFNASGYESENYFGVSVENLASINGGKIIIGKDIYFLVNKGDGDVYLGKSALEQKNGVWGYSDNNGWHELTEEEYAEAEAAGGTVLKNRADSTFAVGGDQDYLNITKTLDDLSKKSGLLANAKATDGVGVKHTSNDGWTLDTTKNTNSTIIVDVDASKYTSLNLDIKVNPGQTVIINVDVTNNKNLSQWSATLNGLTNSEEVVYFDCNVIWNFYEVVDGKKIPYGSNNSDGNLSQLEVGGGRGLFGVVLAPDAEIKYGAINGSVIGRKTVQGDNESHQMNFHTGNSASVTVIKKLFSENPTSEVVTKREYDKDGNVISETKETVSGGTFYFALFIEDADGNWVRDYSVPVKSIRLGNWETKSVSFYGLKKGTKYKVFETDAIGNPVVVDGKYNSYDVTGDGQIVEAGIAGKDTATITNDDHTGGDEEPEKEPDRSEAEYAPKGTKVISGDPDEIPEFMFVIEFTGTDKGGDVNDLVTMPANRTVTLDSAGNFSFDPIKFEAYYDGTYDAYFKIYEVPVGSIPDGWTYDDYQSTDWGGTKYWKLTVKVNEGNKADGKTKEITGLQIDYQWQGDSHNNHQHQQNSDLATFYNDYKLDGFAPKVEKQYSDESKTPATDPTFTFKMKLLDAESMAGGVKWPNDVAPADYTLEATVTGEGEATFPRIDLTWEGSEFRFDVWEEAGDDEDWDYDNTHWTLVAKKEQGTVKTWWEGNAPATGVVFTNTYSGEEDNKEEDGSAQVKVTKTVEVASGTAITDIPEGTVFTFTLSGDGVTTQTKTKIWPTDFANGATSTEVLFDELKNLEAGAHLELTIEETIINPADNWTQTDKEWYVIIDVPAVGGEATVTYKTSKDAQGETSATITNTYTKPAPETTGATISVTKAAEIEGDEARKPASAQFTFELTGENIEKQTGTINWPFSDTNPSTLSFNVSGLEYDKVYVFYVTETDTDGWSVDAAQWKVTVTVSETGEVSYAYEQVEGAKKSGATATFTNTYTVPGASSTDIQFKVAKTYEGPVHPDQNEDIQMNFEFVMEGHTTDNVNFASGNAAFTRNDFKTGASNVKNIGDKITFTEAGTYTFTIKESTEDGKGWRVDTTVWTVTVVVDDCDADGKLDKHVTPDTASAYDADTGVFTATFHNVYSTQSTSLALGVSKEMKAGESGVIPADADKTFSFTLTPEDANGAGYELPENAEDGKVTVTFKGNDTASFGNIKFTAAGVYNFHVTEEADSAWTADVAEWIIEVTVVDHNGELAASVTNSFKKATADAEKQGDGARATVPFVNTYNRAPGDATFAPQAEKTVDIREDVGANPSVTSFEFNLSVQENYGDDVVLPGQTTASADITAETKTATFGDITFKAAGTYYFTITETPKSGDGWTYSTDEWTLEVKVGVDSDTGNLKVVSSNYSKPGVAEADKATFENSYTLNAKTGFEIPVTKNTTGADFSETFEFTLACDETDGVEFTQTTATATTAKVGDDWTGTAKFENITFTKAGTYTFTIEEKKAGAGWTENKTVWTVTVTVEDDGYGQLTITKDLTYTEDSVAKAGPVTFDNVYAAEGSIELEVKKLVLAASGNMPADRDFEFTLSDNNGDDPILTEAVKVSVKAGETKSFGTINFTEEGTYYFTISETKPAEDAAPDGFVYAEDINVIVTVEDVNHNGELTVTVNGIDGTYTAIAINTYTTEFDSLVLDVAKSYTGVTPPQDAEAEFTFTLVPAEDNDATGYVLGDTTATITYPDKSASFGSILFTKPGEYTFTIAEESEVPAGWTADTNKHTVVVTVTDKGGKLEATAVYDEDESKTAADFVNNYKVTEATIDPSVKKTVEGDSADEMQFSFKLVDLNNGVEGYEMTDKTTLTITGEGADTFGTITFTLAGTYEFEITEEKGNIKGMTYDETVWKVTVEVKDLGGKLEATVKYAASNGETSDEAAEFVNNYDKPEEPTATPTPDASATPSVGTATPAVETTTPSVETTTPTVETETPAVETETPEVTETPAPVVRTTNLSGTKTWVDNNNADGMRPEAIEVVLYANGVAQPNVPVWTNTDTNVWTYTFRQLPVTDAFGREIVYTVTETPVELYVTTQDGLNFTNTIVEKEEVELLDLSGEKTWIDNDNENNTRPESITVELLRNGETISTVVVTAADDWKYTFTELPEGDGYGHSYTYTVREQSVPGYYAVYDGMNITNTTLPTRTFTENGTDTPVVARRVPNFQVYNAGELSDMFMLFDYDVPLFGFLLGTGLVVPAYPFIFGGVGLLAVVLVLVFGRKKKEN